MVKIKGESDEKWAENWGEKRRRDLRDRLVLIRALMSCR